MSSTQDRFPDRAARQEGGKAIENATQSAANMLSSAKASAGDLAGNAVETFKSAVEDQKRPGQGP